MKDAWDSGTSELLDDVVFVTCGLGDVLTKRSCQSGLWDVWLWDEWNYGVVESLTLTKGL